MCYSMLYSFFLGELEKCLENPDRLAPLFIKQVRNLPVFFYTSSDLTAAFHIKSFFSRKNYFIL